MAVTTHYCEPGTKVDPIIKTARNDSGDRADLPKSTPGLPGREGHLFLPGILR